MNSTTANQPWSPAEEQQHQLDAMAQLSGSDLDDLSNLFEFGDIDLNHLPAVTDAEEYGSQLGQPQHVSHPATPFTDMTQAPQLGGTVAQDFGSNGQPRQYGMQHGAGQFSGGPVGQQMPGSHPFTTESMYQPAMQHSFSQPDLQQFQYPHHPTGFPSGSIVPPTPNSFEMHGEAGRFLQQQQFEAQQRALLEQRYQVRKDDVIAFTPMVSPAGTPQHFVPPEYAVPGAYFSPLTSPMLHAQQQNQKSQPHFSGYATNPSTAPSSNATSPIDPNVDADMLGGELSLPESGSLRPKRPRKKPATPRSAATSGKTRASPYVKPQKRKSGSMLALSMQSGDAIMQDTTSTGLLQPGSAGLQMPAAFMGSSEDGSISPEPLTESVMGPPPRPGSSVNQSPALAAQQGKSAATPKSILSKGGDQLNGIDQSQAKNGTAGLEDLQLPAAARQEALRPSLTQIDTGVANDQSSNEPTPRLAARKTPKLGPGSTPSTSRPGSSVISPNVMVSPSSATTPGGILKDRRSDSKGARPHKKRGSVSAGNSSMASPALRPRISPSIKPLLPEGTALHSPTHALLLASKSNYQNLLEGNHLPGVSYPDSLSTGLTSKRTSHKVAEQGRRNRINDALKEMQSLVPREYLFGGKGKKASGSADEANAESPDANGEGGGKGEKEDSVAKSNSSKAATVESANVYIRNMQKKQMEEAAENERLRRKLEELEKKLGETSTNSPTVSGKQPSVGSVLEGIEEAAKDSASPASAAAS